MILVTGGNGLIGSFIIRELLQQGCKVKVLHRSNSDLTLLADVLSDVFLCEGDILDIPSIHKALADVEIIIHCAGFISFNPGDGDKLFKVNVEGTSNLINAALNYPVKKFIHLSSVAALGKNKKSGINEVTEDVKWEENDGGVYGKSKYLAELEVYRGAAEGLNVAIVNPSVVIGPGNWNAGSTLLFKYIWDKKPFYTQGLINYVDVRDVASGVINLMKKNISNERFILNSGTVDCQAMFATIAKYFRKPAPKIKISSNSIKVLSFIEKVRSFITKSDPKITKETASASISKTIYINSKAKETLSLSFKKLNESVEWTCGEIAKKYNLQIKN